MARRKAPAIPDDLLDQLLAGGDAATALNSGDLVNALKKALTERALSAEMDYHVGDSAEAENSRNGYGRKSGSTGTGKIEIAIPRDRAGSFDPQRIAKYQRRFPGFDDKIITHYHSDSGSEVVTARSPPIACRSARKGPPCSMALSSGLDQILCSHCKRY